jgi:hypothetical protein
MKRIIVIGLPMYQDISPENKVDSMRFAFVLGRHYPEWEFMLSWRTKAEQFRARNFIVNKAREQDAEFLLFLDDDQIIDWIGTAGNAPYLFLKTLLAHMEDDPKLGIVGALYYQRGGGMYKPVLMHDVGDDAAVFYDDHEIKGSLQEVDIQGGGAMLLRMKMFDKMKEPYFKPETLEDPSTRGTDLQICRKAREYGWKVACDTSIILGHEHSDRIIVSPNNRHLLMEHTHSRGVENIKGELDRWNKKVMDDVVEYLGESERYILANGDGKYYEKTHRSRFGMFFDPEDYYLSIGEDQICRQVVYNRTPRVQARNASIVNMLRTPKLMAGLDFGCGISVIGFEALRMDNYVDFVDIPECAAYEFLKWRITKHELMSLAGFTIGGPYDFVIMLDIIEHIKEWEPTLDNIAGRINAGGAIITNFFTEELREDDPEHFHLDREGVSQFLLDRGFLPSHMGLWIKRDNFLGGAKNVRNFRENTDFGEGETFRQAG